MARQQATSRSSRKPPVLTVRALKATLQFTVSFEEDGKTAGLKQFNAEVPEKDFDTFNLAVTAKDLCRKLREELAKGK